MHILTALIFQLQYFVGKPKIEINMQNYHSSTEILFPELRSFQNYPVLPYCVFPSKMLFTYEYSCMSTPVPGQCNTI